MFYSFIKNSSCFTKSTKQKPAPASVQCKAKWLILQMALARKKKKKKRKTSTLKWSGLKHKFLQRREWMTGRRRARGGALLLTLLRLMVYKRCFPPFIVWCHTSLKHRAIFTATDISHVSWSTSIQTRSIVSCESQNTSVHPAATGGVWSYVRRTPSGNAQRFETSEF